MCKLLANITQPMVDYFPYIQSYIPHLKHKLLWGSDADFYFFLFE